MKNQSNQVKERPIIFSGEMVKAILDGKKTMARRVIKSDIGAYDHGHIIKQSSDKSREGSACFFNKPVGCMVTSSKLVKCPYGKIGDHLWVREAYTVTGWNCDDGSVYIKYLADGHEQYFDNETDEMECAIDSLVASVCKELDKRKVPMLNDEAYDCSLDRNKPRNRSPMLMPRFASRILLEITDIRVERLNDISEADAVKEGLRILPASGRYVVNPGDQHFGGASHDAVEVFSWLWDSLNTKKGYPWSSNPWVWVVEFKVIEVA